MKDVDRREFFKKCYKIGGYAAIAGMGFSAVKEAMAHGILPAVVGTSTGTLYSAWDETTETVKNSAVWLLEGGAAANETGVDSRTVPLTGVDLVGTQAGALAAATGSPPYRSFDGTDDRMSWTQNAFDVIANGTTNWTVLLKLGDVTEAQTEDHSIVDFRCSTLNNGLIQTVHTVGSTALQVRAGGGTIFSANITTPIPTSGIVHLVFWGDGTYVRAGWVGAAGGSGANGQPTKYSDFPSNNRISATATATFPNATFNDIKDIMARTLSPTYTAGKVYYFLMSDTCLIDNAA